MMGHRATHPIEHLDWIVKEVGREMAERIINEAKKKHPWDKYHREPWYRIYERRGR